MKVFRHWTDLPPSARGGVVAVGNFDGVHLGHRVVIGAALAQARAAGRPAGVLTFEPHPRSLFRPDDPPYRLTPFRLKARLIAALGLDCLYVLAFDRALAGLPAESFVNEVLLNGLGTRHLVVGDNFHFGHKRQGDVSLLQAMGRAHGFGVTALARADGPDAAPISSTRIRALLKAGEPKAAAALLGRPFEIEGRVVVGQRLGRKLGFPTANLELGEFLEPAHGIYAVRAALDQGDKLLWRPGVANLGVRPTVGADDPLLEVHLFDFEGDLYERHLRVALVEYLRPEAKFESLEALKRKMLDDAAQARALLEA